MKYLLSTIIKKMESKYMQKFLKVENLWKHRENFTMMINRTYKQKKIFGLVDLRKIRRQVHRGGRNHRIDEGSN
jgi:hypothetical protein